MARFTWRGGERCKQKGLERPLSEINSPKLQWTLLQPKEYMEDSTTGDEDEGHLKTEG